MTGTGRENDYKSQGGNASFLSKLLTFCLLRIPELTEYMNILNICVFFLQSLPSFGPYLKERESIVAKHKEKIDLLSEKFEPEKVRPAYKPDKAAPLIKVIQSNVGIVADSREINVANKNGGESRMRMSSSRARLV